MIYVTKNDELCKIEDILINYAFIAKRNSLTEEVCVSKNKKNYENRQNN